MAPLHTDKEYEAELNSLHEKLLRMTARVERQLADTITAYANNDCDLARACVASDLSIDELEIEIDQDCVQLLARRQPVARDLRYVMMALKVVTDLERIGDLAKNVSKRVIKICQRTPDREPERLLIEMGQETSGMLRDVIDAMVKQDSQKAKAVIERDREVDLRYDQIMPEIAKRVASNGDVEYLMHALSIAKGIERGADHTTNIAEMVIFLVEGDDVRHVRALTRAKLKTPS